MRRLVRLSALFVFLGIVSPAWLPAPSASACSTPVYRYALDNWATAPFVVLYFHAGEIAEQDKPVNALLAKLADAAPPANVAFYTVARPAPGHSGGKDDLQKPRESEKQDKAEKPEAAEKPPLAEDVTPSRATRKNEIPFDDLPKFVREMYKPHADVKTPMHLIVTPWQTELYAGRLDEATVRAMVDSPVRRQIGELIAEGCSSVMLVLDCPKEDENRRAQQVVKDVIAKVKELEAEAQKEIERAKKDDKAEQADSFWSNGPGDVALLPLRVGSLRVSRTDAAEQWLVRMLLQVEPDLNKFPDSPMVFAVYGRGRAMPPYVGKGISSENLIDCIQFLAGPCSCQVKGANPGMDLLIERDWDATAEKVARLAEEQSDRENSPAMGYREIPVGTPGNPPGSRAEGEEKPAPGKPNAPQAPKKEPSGNR